VTVLCDQGSRLVTIFIDRYLSKFYNDKYHEANEIQFLAKESYGGESFNLDFVK
jgi:hypothetical protein